ncbi:hypothetical protein Dsin_002914 [Dipteronia sinensis]|uniref:RING-CH-type domain-containing protein n=1 Tax=Dipteronia sinensis TaxID=43782 RepID=A0AAE0B7Z4_9ROSI|nr:hypothetical protein Dsin_002914 [Dipteronia sinensis]
MESVAKPHVVVVVVEDGGGGGAAAAHERPRSSSTSSSSSSASSSTDSSSSDHEPVVVVGGGGGEIKERRSSVSEGEEEVDLECGGGGERESESRVVVHLARVERDCRICHLSFDATNQESGLPIELGCSCKDDLAAAHKHCAEAWFKIKGNKTCEICGSTACNVTGANEAELAEQWNESSDATPTAATAPMHQAEARNFWQGHRFLNFLLACMVFAFVISWLFHFNIPT